MTGTINMLERDGRMVFEAIAQRSYRERAYRVGHVRHTEADAIAAIERIAPEGEPLRIFAGTYPAGTRSRGSVIA